MPRTSRLRSTTTRTLGALAGAGALVAIGGAPALAGTPVDEPSSFTSAFTVMATPDAVVNPDGVATPGEPEASGTFDLRINSDEEIVCYDITLDGVTPPFQSMARTATHIHQAAAGQAGPPRIAFPNPEGDGELTSSGCLQGPFTTGIEANGSDTGTGFTLAQIEADPAAFAADTHTSAFVAGAVRGQLREVPLGGVATGAGGTAETGSPATLAAGATAGLLGAAALVTVARRRVAVRP